MSTPGPLSRNYPMVDKDGKPTDQFMRLWNSQMSANGTIPGTAAQISALLDKLGPPITKGSLLLRGTTGWGTIGSPNDATQYLSGSASPAWKKVQDSDLSLGANTSNNVSITKHGFAPVLPNDATKYLNGQGAYTVPAGGGGGVGMTNRLLNQPPFSLASGNAGFGGNNYAGLPFFCEVNTLVTGLKTAFAVNAGGQTIAPGIYESTSAAGLLNNATLVGSGPALTPAIRVIQSMPLTTPVTLTAGNWYYLGIWVIGGGTAQMVTTDIANFQNFFGVSGSFPNPAPSSVNQVTASNLPIWAY